MADAAGYSSSRKRYRDPEATVATPFDAQESRSSANRRFEKKVDRGKMKKRSGRSRRRVGATRRRAGGSRRRGASARRTAASYVPPRAIVSSVHRRGLQLVERTPVHIQRSLNPFPSMWKGHMTYGIDTSIGTPGLVPTFTARAYGMNNMYDPNTDLGGHQPYQYDQLLSATGPYTSVTVLGFSYSLRFSDPNTDGAVCGVFWRGYGDSLGTPHGKTVTYMFEQGKCDIQTVSNTGSQNADFSGYVDLPSIVGMTPDQYIGQAEYGHPWDANPLRRLDFYIGLADPNSKVDPVLIRITGWLRYHCLLTGLVASHQS